MNKKIILLVIFFSIQIFAFDIERRKDQVNTTPGYFIFPAPYSIPGVGEGLAFVGLINNINKTETDFLINFLTGDVEGIGLGILSYDVPQYPIQLDLFQQSLSSASVRGYSSRGMNSDKDDFININVGETSFTALRSTTTFFEKKFEVYLSYYVNSYTLDSLTDDDGNLIADSSNAGKQKFDSLSTGYMIDYTDDRIDPRVGIRYDFSLDYALDVPSDSANYYTTNHNLTGYIPIGNISTLTFNYFRSDAHVLSKGETDFNTLQSSGFDCSSLTGTKKTQCEDQIYTTIAANTYGTATSLGGRSRLRSYPEGRFQGAHTEFYGTELRWNLTEETTPFNIWFMKDIRTSIQTAFFYERGSVADKVEDLGKDEKQSFGAGIRLVTGSGLVYRMDIAFGDEDYEYTVIVNYPWESF